MLMLDTPTRQEIEKLHKVRADVCVSIYLPTTPLTVDIEESRIAFANLAKQALAQMPAAELARGRHDDLGEALDDLNDDDEFWRFQANSLAVFATPEKILTYRLANNLMAMAEVSDRFHLKPLLRAVTFPHEALVLALSEGHVRLIEIFPDRAPELVNLPNMPRDAASAVHRSTLNDRSHKRRITGSEGKKVRLAQYARKVDAAIRPLVTNRHAPLILASNEPLATIFRSISTANGLLPGTIPTNERTSDNEIAAAAREVLDQAYAAKIGEFRALYDQRQNARRTTTDVAAAARAATYGAIETLAVDMEQVTYGRIDEETGAVEFAHGPSAGSYDIVDEIVNRALETGAEVLAVREADLPVQAPLAATLRFAM